MASDYSAIRSLLYQKLTVGFSTLLISLAFGLLPYHLSRAKTADRLTQNGKADAEDCCTHDVNGTTEEDPTMPPKWLSLATSFGGGVFIGAALLHLLPEASDVLDDDFPRANLLCSLGYLLVLGLEEIMPYSESTRGASNSSTLALVAALSFHSLFDGLAIGSTTSSGQLKAVSIAILTHKPVSAFALGSILVCKQIVSSQPDKSVEFTENKNYKLENCLPQDRQINTINTQHDRRKGTRRLSCSGRSMAYYYFKYTHDECEKSSCSKKECVCNDLLVDEKGSTATNGDYGSIELQIQPKQHESKDFPVMMIVHIIFFSTTSFIGVIIGALGLQYIESSQLAQTYDATSSSTLGAIVASTCQSLAAGSFLYAATMEALVKERGDHHRHHFHNHDNDGGHKTMIRTNRVGAALVGVAAMASIKLLEA